MIIGSPAERSFSEARVALTPDSARQLQKLGHNCIIQKGAGLKAGFSDKSFIEAGVRVVSTAKSLWKESDVIVKVSAPQKTEVKYLNLRNNFSQLDKLEFQEPSNPSSSSTISRRNNEHDDKEILNKDTQEPSGQISVSREENIEWKWRSIRVNP